MSLETSIINFGMPGLGNTVCFLTEVHKALHTTSLPVSWRFKICKSILFLLDAQYSYLKSCFGHKREINNPSLTIFYGN